MILSKRERLVCTAILGRLMGDVMLTADEIRGSDAHHADPAKRLA
jgi:hypothetical protein